MSDTLNGADSLALVSASLTTATGGGTAEVQATHGALGAFAQSSGSSSPGFGGSAFIAFEDRLTVVSTTLDFGDPVDLNITLDVDYLLSTSGDGSEAGVTAFLGLGIVGVSGSQVTTHFTAFDSLGVVTNIPNAVLHTTVGAVLGLTVQLETSASAISGTATSDALNTLRFYIDPASPAFSYTSETGTGYLTPLVVDTAVPEPATMTMLGLGLAGILFRRRKGSPSGRR